MQKSQFIAINNKNLFPEQNRRINFGLNHFRPSTGSGTNSGLTRLSFPRPARLRFDARLPATGTVGQEVKAGGKRESSLGLNMRLKPLISGFRIKSGMTEKGQTRKSCNYFLFRQFFIVLIWLFLLLPSVALAQNFCEVVPGISIKVPCPIKTTGPAGQKYFGNLAIEIIDIALLVVGSLAVVFLIWGGLRYLTAHGNEEQTEAAKKIITQSIWGLIIVILSFAIIAIITNILVKGQP